MGKINEYINGLCYEIWTMIFDIFTILELVA